MKISNYGIYKLLKNTERNITDFTKDGKCSGCGECCGALLPVTRGEIKRIKRYIFKHNIKPHKTEVAPATDFFIDLTCPFRNEKEKKCDIYEVRPLICKCFMCNYDKTGEIDKRLFKIAGKAKKVNFRDIFK